MRHYHFIDHVLINIDIGIRTLLAPTTSQRQNPADDVVDADLSSSEQKHSAALMRINHAGELSAQGLYQGQALTAHLPLIREKMEQAAAEEIDHLAWCEERINELGSHTTYLAPLWYFGSLIIGATAGLFGDRWSLGFVIETERQVVNHLENHLQWLPKHDYKSRAIVLQMKQDEAHHATIALDAGGAKLPPTLQTLMHYCSKVMTRTTYWL